MNTFLFILTFMFLSLFFSQSLSLRLYVYISIYLSHMLCIHVIIYISIYILFSPYVILGAITCYVPGIIIMTIIMTWYNNYDNNHDINLDIGCKTFSKIHYVN